MRYIDYILYLYIGKLKIFIGMEDSTVKYQDLLYILTQKIVYSNICTNTYINIMLC